MRLLMTIIVTVLLSSTVSADYGTCSEHDFHQMSVAVGAVQGDGWYEVVSHMDLNEDGVINLIDVGIFTRQCFATKNHIADVGNMVSKMDVQSELLLFTNK